MDPPPLGHGQLTVAPEVRRSVTVRVADPDGLHARPCARIARAAQAFRCRVVLSHGGREGDAKSVLELLGLAVLRSADVELIATGDDADACIAALAPLVAGKA